MFFRGSFVFGVIVGSVAVGTIAYCRQKKEKKSHLECGSDSLAHSEHCERCLCNNPVMAKMLLERQAGNIYAQPSSQINGMYQNTNTTVDHTTNWATFDDGASNAEVEVNLPNEDKYDHDFLTKCRDPTFLQTQLTKIEDEYKHKIEKLKNNRANEIEKKEAQYNKIKAEVFSENFFQ